MLSCLGLGLVFISLLAQGLEITFFLTWAPSVINNWIQPLFEAMIWLLSLNDSIKMLSLIAIQKSFKDLDNLLKMSVGS